MKSIFSVLAWCVLAGVILYAAINPATGLVFQGPGAAIGIGLIGLGLCKHAYDKQAASNQ